MIDLLEELREANPVDPLALEPPRLPAMPRRRWPFAPALLAAVIAAAVVLATHGDSPSLAARADAAGSRPGIVHWRIELSGYSNGRLGSRQRIEGWALGKVTHT